MEDNERRELHLEGIEDFRLFQQMYVPPSGYLLPPSQSQEDNAAVDADKIEVENIPSKPTLKAVKREHTKFERQRAEGKRKPTEQDIKAAHELFKQGYNCHFIRPLHKAIQDSIEVPHFFKPSKKIKAPDFYQLNDAILLAEHGYRVLAHETGLGKTLTITMLMGYLREKSNERNGPGGFFLGVVPSNILHIWARSFSQNCNNNTKILVYNYKSQEERAALGGMLHTYDIVLVSFETLSNEFALLRTAARSLHAIDHGEERLLSLHHRTRIQEAPLARTLPMATLYGERPIAMWMDEGNKVENIITGSHMACEAIQSPIKYLVGATPFSNDYGSLQAPQQLCNIQPYNDRQLFNSLFCRRKGGMNHGRKIVLPREPAAILAVSMNAYTITRARGQEIVTSSGVVHNLPKQVEKKISWLPVTLTNEEQKVQLKTMKLWASYDKTTPNRRKRKRPVHEVLKAMMQNAQSILHPRYDPKKKGKRTAADRKDEWKESSKAMAIIERTKEALSKVKNGVVIFVHYKEPASILCDGLKAKLGIDVAGIITGDVGVKAQQKIIDRFNGIETPLRDDLLESNRSYFQGKGITTRQQLDKHLDDGNERVLIVQIKSVTGVDLTAADWTIIDAPSWNPVVEQLAIGRMTRGKRETVCIIDIFYALQSVELLILGRNDYKRLKGDALSTVPGNAKAMMKDEADQYLKEVASQTGFTEETFRKEARNLSQKNRNALDKAGTEKVCNDKNEDQLPDDSRIAAMMEEQLLKDHKMHATLKSLCDDFQSFKDILIVSET